MDALEAKLEEAVRCRQAGQWNRAAALCAQILERRPEDAGALHLLGLMAFQAGAAEAALELISRAAAAAPAEAPLWISLGCVLRAAGRLAEAARCFEQAAALDPHSPEAYSNLGNALRELGRGEQALEPLRRALRLRPDFPEAALNLAAALEEVGRLEEAVELLGRELERRPGFAEARVNLGNILGKQGRLEEAAEQLRQAVGQKPELAAAWNNLGAIYERSGRPREAVACYREAVRRRPDFAEAHLNLGMACLLTGRFQEGWREYEWRLKLRGGPEGRFRRPVWEGSSPEGLRILLTAEQGLGDAIQFVRYVPLLAGRGAVVYLECAWRLAPLLRSVRGLAGIVPAGSVPPDFDVHLPLLSLPRVFGTDLGDIPAEVPYLEAPREGIERWRRWIRRRSAGLSVGLCWASNAQGKNAAARSMRLERLAPLGRIPGLTFFSLQRGPQAAEAAQPPGGMRLEDLEAEAEGILDTAAAIAGLDLVISVDTMVAHLAGALARPVWTLLPFAPDFRWMLERSDSPWYPTMRLFRQPAPGDWDAVIGEVARELSAWQASREVGCHAQHG